MKNTTKLFIALILAFIVVIFSVINAQQIEVNFIVTKVDLPLSIVLISAILIGALIVFIALGGNMWQKNKTIKQLKKTIQDIKTQESHEANDEVAKLKEELKEKELEISDLRHQAVNQIMTDKTQ